MSYSYIRGPAATSKRNYLNEINSSFCLTCMSLSGWYFNRWSSGRSHNGVLLIAEIQFHRSALIGQDFTSARPRLLDPPQNIYINFDVKNAIAKIVDELCKYAKNLSMAGWLRKQTRQIVRFTLWAQNFPIQCFQ